MKYVVFVGIIILTFCLCQITYGVSSEPTMIFLTFETDARSYGMGGVGTALKSGPQASFYNPAAIGGIRHFSLEGSRYDLGYSNFNLTNLSAGYKFGENGTAALSFTGLGLENSFEEFGILIDKSSPYELAVSGSYALELSPNFYVGSSVKYVRSDLSNSYPRFSVANAVAFDLGLLLDNIFPNFSYVNYGRKDSNSTTKVRREENGKGFSIGAAVLNLGADVRYKNNEQKDPLPRLFRMGIAWKPIATEMFQTTLAADYEKSLVGVKSSFFKEFFDPDFFISKYGVEVNFFYVWTFRLGYRQDNPEEDHYQTVGFGFGPHWINVNIASDRGGGRSYFSVIFNYPLDLK